MIEALRRTGVRFAVLGAAAYLVFLVVNLPAAYFGYALERASAGALALADARGTVWKGQGALAARAGAGFRAIADIQWRCNPLPLLAGRLSVALTGTSPGVSLRGNVSLVIGGARFQNVEASAPVALLEPVVPAAALVKPEGRLRLTADSFEISAASVRGAATAEWAEAGMSGVSRVGDYRLQITGSGEKAAIRLATLRGDLRVSGDGEWLASQPRTVELRGMVESSPARKDLEPLVQLLAGPGSGSSRPFGWMIGL